MLFVSVAEYEPPLDVIAQRADERLPLEARNHHTVVRDDVH